MGSDWTVVGAEIGQRAADGLSTWMRQSELIDLHLELEVYGQPSVVASWTVDPRSPEVARRLTSSTIAQALAYQPVPFRGRVTVRARNGEREGTLSSRWVCL